MRQHHGWRNGFLRFSLGAAGMLVILIFHDLYGRSLSRAALRAWYGTETTWHGMTIRAPEGFFLVQKEGFVSIGRYSRHDVVLPHDEFLRFSYAPERPMTDHCPAHRSDVCQVIRFDTPGQPVTCLSVQVPPAEFDGQNSMVRCGRFGEPEIASFHGSSAGFEAFLPIILVAFASLDTH